MLCYCGASVLLLWLWGSAWQGSSLRGSWEKVKMVASTLSLLSLNSQKTPSINYWWKPLRSSAKSGKCVVICGVHVYGRVLVSVCVVGSEGHTDEERRRWRNKGKKIKERNKWGTWLQIKSRYIWAISRYFLIWGVAWVLRGNETCLTLPSFVLVFSWNRNFRLESRIDRKIHRKKYIWIWSFQV